MDQLGGSANPAVAAAAAALADLMGHNIPLAVLAAFVAEIAQRYKRLTQNEGAVFDSLRRLAQGGSIYKVWIDEDQLIEAMDSEMDREDRSRLLANIKSRGIFEEGAGKCRAVW